jgi:multimeric flavodoxin WrbA
MATIAALFSSARDNSNTLKLLKTVQQQRPIDIINVHDYRIAPYDYQHRNSGDQFQSVIDRILPYPHIVFACPVYWSAVTPQMKTFYDRLPDLLEIESYKHKGRQLRGKKTYLLSTSSSPKLSPAFLAMHREMFNYLGMNLQNTLHADCSNGYKLGNHAQDLEEFIDSLPPVLNHQTANC